MALDTLDFPSKSGVRANHRTRGTMGQDKRKIIVIELNEFNRDLMRDCAEKFDLPSLKKILSLRETRTFSRDNYESDFLEPWSQWVTVHTGMASSDHGIKHLGDVTDLRHPQIWEKLSDRGVRTGVWGAINGSRGAAENCAFFLPDPWTFSEPAYPADLNYLIELPRYLAKNRKKMRLSKIIGHFTRFFGIFSNPEVLKATLLESHEVVKQTLKDGVKEYVGFTFFEYLSTIEFIRQWRNHHPDVSFLFLNTVAHIQHYYWDLDDERNAIRFRYSMSFLDRILEKVLSLDTEIIVYNALSQTNTLHEPEWVSYRPIDHDQFLRHFGIAYKRVEPLMSYDAILLFDRPEDKLKAQAELAKLVVSGVPLLQVENYKGDALKLFYRLAFTDPVGSEARIEGGSAPAAFYDLMAKITSRTGKHVPVGNIFSTLELFPNVIENTDVMKIVEGHVVPRRQEEASL